MREKLEKLLKLLKQSEEKKFTGEITLYFHNGDLSNKIGQKKMMHILDVHKLNHKGIDGDTPLSII